MKPADSPTTKVLIAGAGPAGLTAAYELATRSGRHSVTVFEASGMVGGISRTINYNGNRIDIGGHRFFSKIPRVTAWWHKVMPLQTAPALDEILLGARPGADASSDPQQSDRVMLRRHRVSRIYYLRRFFDYPVSLSLATLRAMGPMRTLKAAGGYLAARMARRPDDTLENFYINRFGRPLYRMFFEKYTEKVWGIHPSRLDAAWGAQRVKGLSLKAVLKDIATKKLGLGRDASSVETSLIEEFLYPKLGPGQLWETVADDAVAAGAELQLHSQVRRIHVRDGRVAAVTVEDADGRLQRHACDIFMSSMPVKDLVASLDGIDIPDDVRRIAAVLPYRDFITVGLLVDRLKIANTSRLRTYAGRVPDTWIYVQEPDVRLGRIQIFNNWSPYMVADYENTLWIGLEYFCSEGDDMWTMPDDAFIAMAVRELASIGIIDEDAVRDAVRINVAKAYPAYFGTYEGLPAVRTFLDSIGGLYCIGRNGQHRYNNMDHSMLTAMRAVDAIIEGREDGRDAVWDVNTEQAYHEQKSE